MKKDSCLICQIVEGKIPSFRVYEGHRAVAILDVNGANPGHCFVIPKIHYPILEQVPDDDIAEAFSIANKLSVALFDHLGAEGTNIFVANGIPAGQTVAHFMVNVIPRRQNDGINLQWQPKQITEEEVATIELKLKDELAGTGVSHASRKAAARKSAPSVSTGAPRPSPAAWDGDEDPAVTHLRRIP